MPVRFNLILTYIQEFNQILSTNEFVATDDTI